MKKLVILCMSMMMLTANTIEGKETVKTHNLVVGVTPALGRMTGSFKFDAKDAPKDKFTYNKEIGVTVGYERVLNGFIIMPELRWFRGSQSDQDFESNRFIMPYELPYTTATLDDINEFGFMEWLGFTINSKHRFQIPIMGGIGVSYVKGAPFHNIFFDYGAKVRMKFYITPKFGIFVGGFYEGGIGSSKRNIPSDEDDKYNLKKTNLGMEAGVTFTL